jgi:hypothetical protein
LPKKVFFIEQQLYLFFKIVKKPHQKVAWAHPAPQKSQSDEFRFGFFIDDKGSFHFGSELVEELVTLLVY